MRKINQFKKYSISSTVIVILIAAITFLDQLTKYIVKTNMQLGQQIPVLGDFFKLTYIENPGMAFGIRFGNANLFLALSFFAAVLVFYYLYRLRNEGWLIQVALSFISAGAIGNIVDRFMYGRVIDFLDFEFFNIIVPAFNIFGVQFSGYQMYRWPVFNVADMAVSTGMIILIIYLIFIGDPLKQTPDTATVSDEQSS
ncbi:MAG: signal peptidase II [Caldithrix sp.]|nr:signal peptidase II [Caldithrix sp.]